MRWLVVLAVFATTAEAGPKPDPADVAKKWLSAVGSKNTKRAAKLSAFPIALEVMHISDGSLVHCSDSSLDSAKALRVFSADGADPAVYRETRKGRTQHACPRAARQVKPAPGSDVVLVRRETEITIGVTPGGLVTSILIRHVSPGI